MGKFSVVYKSYSCHETTVINVCEIGSYWNMLGAISYARRIAIYDGAAREVEIQWPFIWRITIKEYNEENELIGKILIKRIRG